MRAEVVLLQEFDSLKTDLIAKHKELGMEASGDFIRSLEVVQDGLSIKLIGNKYAEQLEYGRRPSAKMPPIEAIIKWVQDKGIESEIRKATGIAWAIAKKIQKQGWKRERHGGVELVSQVITPKRMQSIIDKVGLELTLYFANEFTVLMNKELSI